MSGHRRDNDNDAIASLRLSLHVERRVSYTAYVSDGGSAKLHDEEHDRELWCQSEMKKRRRRKR
jgi:hypothetical protein